MIEQLTRHQYNLLKRMANGDVKVYCSPIGIPSDMKSEEVTRDHENIMRLVELGLMSDVTSWPKFQPLVKKYKDEENRDVKVVNLNNVADRMFRRVAWGKWVN